MYIVYYISVTTVGTFVTDWTNDVFVVAIQDAVSGFLSSVGASGLLSAVIVDGIIGGVGAVIGFAPQMAILFLFLSILEGCGYRFVLHSSWIEYLDISVYLEKALFHY